MPLDEQAASVLAQYQQDARLVLEGLGTDQVLGTEEDVERVARQAKVADELAAKIHAERVRLFAEPRKALDLLEHPYAEIERTLLRRVRDARQLMNKWRDDLRRRAEEERRREEERLREEAASRAAREPARGRGRGPEAPPPPLPPPVLAALVPKQAGMAVRFREVWDFRVTDVELVPRRLMVVDADLVRREVRAAQAEGRTPDVPGIEFYKRSQATI
jgi:hypothetical protein